MATYAGSLCCRPRRQRPALPAADLDPACSRDLHCRFRRSVPPPTVAAALSSLVRNLHLGPLGDTAFLALVLQELDLRQRTDAAIGERALYVGLLKPAAIEPDLRL